MTEFAIARSSRPRAWAGWSGTAIGSTTFFLNDRPRTVSRSPGTILLDALREEFGFTGAKDGCREGDCGACLVLLGAPRPEGIVYRTVNSCLLPLGETEGRHVVTVEGLDQPDLSPVQGALTEEGAVQCGFCTPGIVVALTGFLLSGAPLTMTDGIAALGGNICRCTGYVSIRRAVGRLVERLPGLEQARDPSARVAALVEGRILPEYFLKVPSRLREQAEAVSAGRPAKKGQARSPVLVAGGTDLFVTQADALGAAELVFLSRREDLRGVRLEDGFCVIGAATPLIEIEESPVMRRLLPGLGRHFGRVSSPPVRNRATVAGNIANASPAGDLSVMFLALDSSVVLDGSGGRRTVRLRDFFRGYKVLDMAPGEMIVEVRFPVPDASTLFEFEKVGRRLHMDIASVNSALRLSFRDGQIAEARAAAGGVAPVPLYLRNTSDFLRGRPVSAETALRAAAIASDEASPISDVRGSAGYKRALLQRLIAAHFLTMFPESIRESDLA